MREEKRPLLLLLPGLLCTGTVFSELIGSLDQRIKSKVRELPAYSSIKEIAEAIRLPEAGEVILCGLSFGGIISMELLRQHPGSVSALILIDTNAWSETKEVSEGRYHLVEEAKRLGCREMTRNHLLHKLVSEAALEDERLSERICQMADAIGPEVFSLHAQALASRCDYSLTLSAWDGPALIIAGQEDQLTPLNRQHHLHSILAGSELTLLPGCGHLSTMERPQEVRALIERFLEKHGLI